MCRCVISSVLVPFLAFGVFVLRKLDVFKSITYNLDCAAVGSDILSNSEDLTYFKDGIIFASAGDIGNLFKHGIDGVEKGKIFAVDLNTIQGLSMETPKEIPLLNFPKGRRFQPHGLYYSNRSNNLYAVSHPYQGEGSFVEIFNVRTGPLSLEHVDSMRPTGSMNGIINDVVEGPSASEFFVSTWLWYSKPLGGDHGARTVEEKLNEVKESIGKLVIPADVLVRCNRGGNSTANTGNWECAEATEMKGQAYNGLATSTDRTRLFAVARRVVGGRKFVVEG